MHTELRDVIMKNDKIYACDEHVDIALDDFVNESEIAPQLIKVQDADKEKCSYCDNKAVYEVTE